MSGSVIGEISLPTAWKCLQALERQDYDGVLMDIQMPEMDGLKTTARIRKRGPLEKQPWIIALTANALVGDRKRYLAAGMNDYISKPVKIDELAAVLTRCPTYSLVTSLEEPASPT